MLDLIFHLLEHRVSCVGFDAEEAHIVFDGLEFVLAAFADTEETITFTTDLVFITLEFGYAALVVGHTVASLARVVSVIESVADLTIFCEDLILIFKRNETNGLPITLELLDLGHHLVAVAILGEGFKSGDDGTFLIEVFIFDLVALLILAFTFIEEIIASGGESLPEGIAMLAGDATDSLPLSLEFHHLVGGSLKVGSILESFSLLAESGFLLEV